MPCDDARFAELPAEENDLVAGVVGEIDQAEVDVLEDASHGFDLGGGVGHVSRERPQLGIAGNNLAHGRVHDGGIGDRQFVDAFAQRGRLHLELAHQDF